ncbi:MAG: sigma-54-dependent Fis family transcriptional regulator [Planctomycetia bacterium]|nr:sigma-54-dependent Fis family transcriptional regulator [Planctomycetia bacterium]
MPKLLIVDDEPNVLYSLKKRLGTAALEVLTARTAKLGVGLVERERPDAVILDIRLPDQSGLDAFERMHQIDPRLPVILITAYATTETAIEAMKRGAYEYLVKPVDFNQLRGAVTRAIELSRLRHVPAVFDDNAPAAGEVDRIVGRSPAMQEVYKAVGRVAPQDMTVLILGESGTGKELVARAVYHHSPRSAAPFLAINCAAIPESLLESELFGHERGSFTGADRRRIGKFEQAHGGTLFLDEIGDMTPATQAKVLRLLQEQRFERVGGNETVQTNVRVLAATNQNLEALVAAGRFRKDLFYRLKVFTITLPALRERREDLAPLVEHFVKLVNRELGKHVRSVSPDALRLLEKYDWPGNVRELQSTIRYALVLAAGEVLTAECLPESVRCGTPAGATPPAGESGAPDIVQFVRGLLQAGATDIYQKAGAEFDRLVLMEVLRHVKGHQVRASELLGMSRNTLRAKLRALGMALEKHLAETEHEEQILPTE